MRTNEDISIGDCRQLLVRLFVIGYTSCGESIVMLFVDGACNKVLYTIVIDSYKLSDGTFKTIDILNEYKIDHIDLLCWSHPDADHSKGIDEIFDYYCDKDSIIFFPTYMNGLGTDPISYNRDDLDIINKMFGLNDRKNKPMKPVGANIGMTGDRYIRYFSDGIHRLPLIFTIYAPHKDYLVEKFRNENKKSIKKNQLSIFMVVSIGPYMFDFCGDVENTTINNMQEEPFNCPTFIKIPHHASSNALDMLEKVVVDSSSLCCTTTYKSKGLPDPFVLDRYKAKVSYCHSTGIGDGSHENYGIVEYIFDFFGTQEVHIVKRGNAYRV